MGKYLLKANVKVMINVLELLLVYTELVLILVSLSLVGQMLIVNLKNMRHGADAQLVLEKHPMENVFQV